MIDIDDRGDVAVITLDRPDRRNAITLAGLERLEAAIERCSAPVVLLQGAGDTFCAGADRSTVAEIAAEGGAKAFVRQGQRTATAIETTSSVVVAGIDGAVRGGGVELALACDIRVGTHDATFAEPGVTFGLFGAWGGTIRLPEIVGRGDALDFSLSGRVIDSEEALRIGLISRIVDDPHTVADRIAENDPRALGHVKDRIRDRSNRAVQEDCEASAFAALIEANADELRRLDE
jgi:enoyl-CoA hydratase/carnithine racemase